MSEVRFTVGGIDVAGPELFGLWTAAPETVHFGGAEAADGETRWRVALPDDQDAAAGALRARSAALRTTVAGLEQAGREIRGMSPDVSFGTPASAAQRRLRESLRAAAQAESAVAFGVVDRLRLPENWSENVAEFNGFLVRLGNLVRPGLEVESVVGKRPVAVTRVGLDGDQRTTWHVVAAAALHRDTLRLALETRKMLLTLLVRTVGGAAILAGRFVVPGGAIVALPATYRFIRDVVADVRRLAT